MAVALSDKVEVAYARLTVGVEAINRHALCQVERGGGERGKCAAEAVTGDPERLRFVLESGNVGENQVPDSEKTNCEASMRIADARAFEIIAKRDLLGVDVGHPIEQLIGAGTAKGDDDRIFATGNESLHLANGADADIVKAATRSHGADRGLILVGKVGSVREGQGVEFAPTRGLWIKYLEGVDGVLELCVWRWRWSRGGGWSGSGWSGGGWPSGCLFGGHGGS